MVSNPYAGYPVTGSWFDHASYSAGGIDYPLAYGTALPAPAAGTLRTSGGSGEWTAGWYGSAGRRSILMLDTPAPRRAPAEATPPEGSGDMVAIVFQHQSEFGAARHYAEGETLGWSGASADGTDYGGDVHLHIHGLNASGQRVDFTKFIGPSTTTPHVRNNNGMSSLFHIQNTDGSHTWALAGDGRGTAAWLQISDVNVANGLAGQHGTAVNLDWGTWQAWKTAYLSKEPVQQ